MYLLSFFEAVDAFIWCPFLVVTLVAMGAYFTFKLRFIQIRRLGLALRLIRKEEAAGSQKGDVSPLASLCTALSATIGSGNIVGMATAVTAGSPGALFWMSVAAFFGMATKYAESLLAVKYRTFDADGKVCGGPMVTIDRALGMQWLARLFALFAWAWRCSGSGHSGRSSRSSKQRGRFTFRLSRRRPL